MYTATPTGPADPGHWDIYDEDGDFICTVCSRSQAEALLSHLNRG